MPFLITRQQAISEIEKKLSPGQCLVCWLHVNSKYILHKGKHTTVVLSEYPRSWGQTMILLNSHKTSVSEVTKEEWEELTENTRKAAVVIENTLKPLRCYIASLGSTENLPNTCPHLHFNLQPIYNASDKPDTIFSWKEGVYTAEEGEWTNLVGKLKKGWK
jgi:diadenosine tetraphosphate (Ap4A) HIT family hydrolase